MTLELINAMFDMAKFCTVGLFYSNPEGKRELAAVIRQIADMVESDAPTEGDCLKITNMLAAWANAKKVVSEGKA